MKRSRRIRPDESVSVSFTARERTLVLEHTFAGPELTEPLEASRQRRGKYAVRYTLDDLDELLGHVAAEVNHSKSKTLQRELDALHCRLQAEMESYDDGHWQNPLEPGGDVPHSELRAGRVKLALVKGRERP